MVLGLWLLLLTAFVVHATGFSPPRYGRWVPPLIGFMGWDGGRNALWDAGVRSVPRLGTSPSLLVGVLLALIAVAIVAVALAHLRRRPPALRAIAWSTPLALLLTAASAAALHWTGLWSPYFVRETALIHYGHRLDAARGVRPWLLLLGCWAVAATGLHLIALRRRSGCRRLYRVAAFSLIPTPGLLLLLRVGLDMPGGRSRLAPAFTGAHSSGVLVLLTAFWCAVVLGLLLIWPPPPMRRLLARSVTRATPPSRCRECGYDLRGTLAAGRTTCPECGAPAPAAG